MHLTIKFNPFDNLTSCFQSYLTTMCSTNSSNNSSSNGNEDDNGNNANKNIGFVPENLFGRVDRRNQNGEMLATSSNQGVDNNSEAQVLLEGTPSKKRRVRLPESCKGPAVQSRKDDNAPMAEPVTIHCDNSNNNGYADRPNGTKRKLGELYNRSGTWVAMVMESAESIAVAVTMIGMYCWYGGHIPQGAAILGIGMAQVVSVRSTFALKSALDSVKKDVAALTTDFAKLKKDHVAFITDSDLRNTDSVL